jgi:pyridoxamine 5'-phosphate oxidase
MSRDDPLELLGAWLEAARRANEPMPEAMTLASASADGVPSARMVILRGVDHGLRFFTDTGSAKAIELEANPRAAAVFHWLAPAHRQVRVAGPTERVSDEEAEAYWQGRPVPARRSAIASFQSRVIPSRSALAEELARVERDVPAGDLTRPDRWSGFRIVPSVVEFWQESVDGLHDRVRYRRVDGAWEVDRLSP